MICIKVKFRNIKVFDSEVSVRGTSLASRSPSPSPHPPPGQWKSWENLTTRSERDTVSCPQYLGGPWPLGELGSVLRRPTDCTCMMHSENIWVPWSPYIYTWEKVKPLQYFKTTAPQGLNSTRHKWFRTIFPKDFLNSDQAGGGGLWCLRGGEKRTRVSGRGRGNRPTGRPASRWNQHQHQV